MRTPLLVSPTRIGVIVFLYTFERTSEGYKLPTSIALLGSSTTLNYVVDKFGRSNGNVAKLALHSIPWAALSVVLQQPSLVLFSTLITQD